MSTRNEKISVVRKLIMLDCIQTKTGQNNIQVNIHIMTNLRYC